MEAITLVLIAAIGLVELAAVAFWHQILQWSEKNLFPWFEKHLPTVAPYVRDAFSRLDRVATNIRLTIKAAWKKIREYLLKQVVEFNRQTSNTYTWIQQVTSWVIETLDDNSQPVVKEIRTEQKVSWDDLPEELREAVLKKNKSSFGQDVTDIRERELLTLSA